MKRAKSFTRQKIQYRFKVTGIIFTFLILPLSLCFAQPTFAQDDRIKYPKDIVPPPLNVITKEDKKLLKEQNKARKRVKLALKLMDERLANSENFVENNDYQNALNELGYHQGILINTVKYLKRNQARRGSVRNFKKLEISLRDVIPQLELIRRNMPYRYGFHVIDMIDFVRDSRTKALDHLFDDTVVPTANN